MSTDGLRGLVDNGFLKKPVMVTGASGHVGANLVRALLAQGREVRVLVCDDDRRAFEGLDLDIVEGDVSDPRSLNRAFTGAGTVYHLASYISILMTEWPKLEAVNVHGTRNVVDACRSAGVRRLVHFSSIEALEDASGDEAQDQSRPLVTGPDVPPYPRSKARADQIVRDAAADGLDAVILYPTGIIGPFDFRVGATSELFIGLVGRKFPATVEGGFDWVDVRDVAHGATLAERLAPAGSKFILSGRWISTSALAALVGEVSGVPAPRFVSPLWLALLFAPAMTALSHARGRRALFTSAGLRALEMYGWVNSDLAAKHLGYSARPLRQTVSDTLRWLDAQGHLPVSPP